MPLTPKEQDELLDFASVIEYALAQTQITNGFRAIRDAALCWATVGTETAGTLNLDISGTIGFEHLFTVIECVHGLKHGTVER